MTAYCKTYASEAAAREAVKAMSRDGVRDVALLIGSRVRDVRREPVGAFAGVVGPDAPVATYGNRRHVRRRARGGFAGDPDRWRQGSFADSDRVVIVTQRRGDPRSRIVGSRAARRLLRDTRPIDEARRAIDELAEGGAAVLVDARDDGSPLEQLRRAA